MKNKLLLIAFALLASTSGFAQKNNPASTGSVTVKPDLPYTRGKQGDLLGDLYLPRQAKAGNPLPVIVYIHGGGWIKGSRSNLGWMAQYMADRGYAGFAIDYDLIAAGGTFPVSIDECWRAIEFLHDHAAEYGIDPNRIAVAGGSAGGELSGLIAFGVRAPAGVPPVKAAALLNAVIDLRGATDDRQLVTRYLGKPCSQLLKVCAEASPMAAAHAGAPSIYIGHGTADHTVPYQQAVDLNAKLKSLGVKTETFTAEGGPHSYFTRDEWKQKNLTAMAEFFNKYL